LTLRIAGPEPDDDAIAPPPAEPEKKRGKRKSSKYTTSIWYLLSGACPADATMMVIAQISDAIPNIMKSIISPLQINQ
jgi:hypothetical protein